MSRTTSTIRSAIRGLTVLGLVAGLAVVGACAYEAGTEDYGDEHAVFIDWDADSDDRLDEREWTLGVFHLWDEDADATLDEEEWNTSIDIWLDDPDRVNPFADWDVDADGFIDEDEWEKAFAEFGDFDDWDLDADGWIDADEFQASFEWNR